MSRRVNRRNFLQASAVSAGAAGFWLTGGLELRGQNTTPANNRLNIAIVGCGGQGGGNLRNVVGTPQAPTENLVALCDVDDARARDAFNAYPTVGKFKDFRVMLDRVRNIDAVVVSTPDHTHAHASIAAMQAGKHVYCEKPLTHSVWEARQMKEAATRFRVQTQMGNHGTADNRLREGVEAIRAGILGQVTEVHAWTNRPIWPQPGRRPKQTPDVPATLDWNLWQGPAPERPFHTEYLPFAWRGWWDYGTGALGDMGCHTMNLPFLALRLGAPSTVEANIDGTLNSESPPNGCTITYEFPAVGNRNALRLYWYERRYPPERLTSQLPPPPPPAANARPNNRPNGISESGCIMVGERGMLYSAHDYGGRWVLVPEERFAGIRPLAATLPRSPGHHREWIAACKGGAPAMSNFIDHASILTETVLLGNVAIRVGQKFTWDSENLRATDCPAAAQYVRRDYRQGWNL